MYFGPMDEALPYLSSQGFDRPIGKSEFDFMEELTGNSAKFWAARDQPKQSITATSDGSAGVPDGFEVTDEIVVGSSSMAPPTLTRSTSNSMPVFFRISNNQIFTKIFASRFLRSLTMLCGAKLNARN